MQQTDMVKISKEKYLIIGTILIPIIIIGGKAHLLPKIEPILTANTPPTITAGPQIGSDPNLVISHQLEDVEFCKKTYQSEQIYIKQVNITKKIAELASNWDTKENSVCINIENDTVADKKLPIEVNSSEGQYYITISRELYKVDPINQTIYLASAFDGQFKTLLGKY